MFRDGSLYSNGQVSPVVVLGFPDFLAVKQSEMNERLSSPRE